MEQIAQETETTKKPYFIGFRIAYTRHGRTWTDVSIVCGVQCQLDRSDQLCARIVELMASDPDDPCEELLVEVDLAPYNAAPGAYRVCAPYKHDITGTVEPGEIERLRGFVCGLSYGGIYRHEVES